MADSGNGYVTVTFHVYEEDGQYVGRCMELGISSCATSLGKALERAQEATTLYLNTLEEVGERARVFSEAGIQISRGKSHEPLSVIAYPDEGLVALRSLPVRSYSFT